MDSNHLWDKENQQWIEQIGSSDGRTLVNPDTGELTETSGNQKYYFVSDIDVSQVLGNILKELKIMNMHMTLITDTHIRKQEIE